MFPPINDSTTLEEGTPTIGSEKKPNHQTKTAVDTISDTPSGPLNEHPIRPKYLKKNWM